MSAEELRYYVLVFAIFSLGFGAGIGSFLNVCIWRIPRGESIVRPRSHCPKCGMLIPWYLNIPVLSWCWLRGKCAKCKEPISFRYTLVEMLTAMLFLLVYMQLVSPANLGLQPLATPFQVPCYWLFISGLIVGTFVDFDHFILPDSITLGGMAIGPVLCALVPQLQGEKIWYHGLLWSGIGEVVGFGLLFAVAWIGELVFKKEAMGFGDVKLMGAIGAFLGWKAVIFTVFFSSLLGSVCGLSLMAVKGAKLQSRIPFGPYLAAAAVVWIFWGPALLRAYLSLAGGK